MSDDHKGDDDSYPPEEAERRARDAIRRSFQMPYRPQREMIGKTERVRPRTRKPPKTTPKER